MRNSDGETRTVATISNTPAISMVVATLDADAMNPPKSAPTTLALRTANLSHAAHPAVQVPGDEVLASGYRADIDGYGTHLLQAEHEDSEDNRVSEGQSHVTHDGQDEPTEDQVARPKPLLHITGEMGGGHPDSGGESEEQPVTRGSQVERLLPVQNENGDDHGLAKCSRRRRSRQQLEGRSLRNTLRPWRKLATQPGRGSDLGSGPSSTSAVAGTVHWVHRGLVHHREFRGKGTIWTSAIGLAPFEPQPQAPHRRNPPRWSWPRWCWRRWYWPR